MSSCLIKKAAKNIYAVQSGERKSGMAEKKTKSKLLMYKGKPLVRHGNIIFYGNPNDKYIVSFVLSDFEMNGETEVAGHVSVQLQQNDRYLNPKNKLIKKAERDDLWSALDIGIFWLEDALEQG